MFSPSMDTQSYASKVLDEIANPFLNFNGWNEIIPSRIL